MSATNLVLGFLIEGDQVIEGILMGRKKRGYGTGFYNGFGGKVEEGEGISRAMIREFKEELGIEVNETDLETLGVINFLYPWRDEGEREVTMFVHTTRQWKGDIVSSEGTLLKWFSPIHFPYSETLPYDVHWFPYVLDNMFFSAQMTFDKRYVLLRINTSAEEDEERKKDYHG